ncbi:MAG TPA: hypothetical protein VN999_06615 [Thermoanaerobaculia bacterium]|nr:hypothetical protein [Thermoanaerobaculia bacterium]
MLPLQPRGGASSQRGAHLQHGEHGERSKYGEYGEHRKTGDFR